jgi:O-antigen/teichoic acid export membrane protein
MKANVLINLIAKIWTGIIAFLIVPVYIHYLGIERWGMVGVYMAMLPVIFLIDAGLGSNLNRTFARLSVEKDSASEMRDSLRTMEFVFWGLSLLIAFGISLAAPFLADHFVHAKYLSHTEIVQAIEMMGLSTAILFPFGLYQGGFMGLQRQAHFNVVLVVFQTLRVFGAIPFLNHFGSTLIVFFIWQVIVTSLQNLAAALILWNLIPSSSKAPRARMDILQSARDFSLGVLWVNLLGTIISQIDRPMMGAFRSSADVGDYATATVAAGIICNLSVPVTTAAYPKFSELVARDDQSQLKESFHVAAQAMSILVIPCMVIICGFPEQLFKAWDPHMQIHPMMNWALALLTIGWSFNALAAIPYSMQLAHGWTKLTAGFNLVMAVLQFPILIWIVPKYGGVGAASVWGAINLLMALIVPNIMFNTLLKDSRIKWYFQDVALPLIVCCLVFLIFKLMMPVLIGRWEIVGYLGLAFVCCSLVTAVSMSDVRNQIFKKLSRNRNPNPIPIPAAIIDQAADGANIR